MKKILTGITLALISSLAFAGLNDPFEMRYVQNNSTGNGTLNRYIPFPTGGASCIHYLDGPSVLPGCLLLGSGLSIASGTLNVSAPTAPAFNFGAPVNRTLALATSYQALTPAKAAIISISTSCSASISLTTGTTCTNEVRVAPSAVTCSTGVVVAQNTNGNTGTLTIGLALTQTVGSVINLPLPIGYAFAVCQTSGTGTTIPVAVDQTVG